MRTSPPRRLYLIAFDTRFVIDWRSLCRSASTYGTRIDGDVDRDIELLGLRLHQGRNLADDLLQGDGFEREVELPCIEPRHVEDLVY